MFVEQLGNKIEKLLLKLAQGRYATTALAVPSWLPVSRLLHLKWSTFNIIRIIFLRNSKFGLFILHYFNPQNTTTVDIVFVQHCKLGKWQIFTARMCSNYKWSFKAGTSCRLSEIDWILLKLNINWWSQFNHCMYPHNTRAHPPAAIRRRGRSSSWIHAEAEL